jgi:hypothetical protein
MNMKRLALLAITAIAALAAIAPATAGADVVRSGNTFTATPSYCSCWSTVDGYVFDGIPYSPFVRDVFLHLPAGTPVVVDGENTGIADKLRASPDYLSLPPVTSGSVQTTVSGTVEDAQSGDECTFTDADEEEVAGTVQLDEQSGELACVSPDGRSSWGRSSWGRSSWGRPPSA